MQGGAAWLRVMCAGAVQLSHCGFYSGASNGQCQEGSYGTGHRDRAEARHESWRDGRVKPSHQTLGKHK